MSAPAPSIQSGQKLHKEVVLSTCECAESTQAKICLFAAVCGGYHRAIIWWRTVERKEGIASCEMDRTLAKMTPALTAV